MGHRLPPQVAAEISRGVIKEICIGLTLGLMAGGLWKTYHWKQQKKTREFYDMLDRGEISVVHDE